MEQVRGRSGGKVMELKEEAQMIKKALVLNWECQYCKTLGFNITSCSRENKDSCADILYRNLRQHFYHAIKEEYAQR